MWKKPKPQLDVVVRNWAVCVFIVAQSAHSNPSVCKHGAESWRTEEMWAAVLVLLSLCSSAQREEEEEEEEGGRKAGGRLTNCPSSCW